MGQASGAPYSARRTRLDECLQHHPSVGLGGWWEDAEVASAKLPCRRLTILTEGLQAHGLVRGRAIHHSLKDALNQGWLVAWENSEVLSVVIDTLKKIIAHDGEVFGKARRECGNYKNLDLSAAKREAERYLACLLAREQTFTYKE